MKLMLSALLLSLLFVVGFAQQPATPPASTQLTIIVAEGDNGSATPTLNRVTRAGTTHMTELESTTLAKRALVKLETIDYNRIKDGKRRSGVRRAVNAVKALAANTSPAREASLISKLNLAVNGLKPRGGNDPSDDYQKCVDKGEECGKEDTVSPLRCDLAYMDCITAAYGKQNMPGQLPD